MKKTLLSIVAFLLIVSCTRAHAQNSVKVVGTFIKDGAPPSADAVAEAKIFGQVARQFPLREKQWKWVIVADDALWHQLIIRMGFRDDPRISYYGQTDLEGHQTYIRGWTLLHPDQPDAAPEHVIAHEMAHVYLHSTDEVVVDKTAHQWMKDAAAKQAIVVASVSK